MRRRAIVITIVLVVLGVVWLAVRHEPVHRLTLRAYFRHVQNVQKGMAVCVDGVQVGSVDAVTVRPERGDRPVEVVLKLRTPYALQVPSGSTAQVAEPGIMRPAVVDIDT